MRNFTTEIQGDKFCSTTKLRQKLKRATENAAPPLHVPCISLWWEKGEP